MSIQEYLEKMTAIQNSFLEYIDQINEYENDYNNLIHLLETYDIKNNQHDLKSFLHLIIKVCNNHFQTFDFYVKIERVLSFFKTEIKQSFSNYEIFLIFKSNKKIILYLIKEGILELTQYIADTIIYGKYSKLNYIEFLYPEIKPFLTDEMIEPIAKSLPEDFEEDRKIGVNHYPICKLIQNDSVKEFIVYMNQNNIDVNGTIRPSIFETNSFLNKTENITLLQYAAFHGAIQIFNYLITNEAEIDENLYKFVIHSSNEELIYFLQEKRFINFDKPENVIIESIKCHHNNLTEYFKQNMNINFESIDSIKLLMTSLKYYNFSYIQKDKINNETFQYLCTYDYYQLVEILLKTHENEINLIIILNQFRIYNILKKKKVLIRFFYYYFNDILKFKFFRIKNVYDL